MLIFSAFVGIMQMGVCQVTFQVKIMFVVLNKKAENSKIIVI